jgi:hypothetical protein
VARTACAPSAKRLRQRDSPARSPSAGR